MTFISDAENRKQLVEAFALGVIEHSLSFGKDR